ncbi:MAG TPA: aldose epimerase family protein, partial [Sphingobacterium sp.]|nr:aldose epimerase family protein [Sphingobacterium sp.]
MANYKLPEPKDFLGNIHGKNTHLFVLTNEFGMQIALTDYGARLVSALIPDKHGNLVDVILGFGSIKGYLSAKEQYHGATIGRYANRIANGKFVLGDTTYELDLNNGPNSLHGGVEAFHTKVWDRQISNFKKRIDFYYVSPDGEEGFPGKLKTHVSYELTDNNEIVIRFRATTDKTTVVNLTNHAYFNLNGEGTGDVLHHLLHIPSEEYLPINKNQIPLGKPHRVQDTAFDFTSPRKIADSISNQKEEQLQFANGYDHGFVNTQPFSVPAASAYSEQSGITLDVLTTEPSVHLYTGNFLADDLGKSGQKYLRHGGFCFEAQHYPDSPNQQQFPNVIL